MIMKKYINKISFIKYKQVLHKFITITYLFAKSNQTTYNIRKNLIIDSRIEY
jgi:hypothetical protein